ncbi:hypothetical protein Btru_073297 [Bulinus truncatus]|nr:hypothetical protein Btru_073297 [Bulinus truncatus]
MIIFGYLYLLDLKIALLASKTRDGSSKKTCQHLSWIAKLDQQLEHLEKILLIKPKNCNILNTKLKDCVSSFSFGKEETRDYCLGWKFLPCSEFEKVNSLSSRAWTYTPAKDIQGLPIAGNHDIYNGGGYIINMNFNANVTLAILKELRTNYWIDHETRAVFIEFTLYSPNINHFAYIILLLEFDEMGGLIPFVSVYPVSVHNPPGLLGSFVQFCQLIGIVLTILGVLYVIFVLGKKKCSAFKDLWFLFDLSAVIIAICAVIMFLFHPYFLLLDELEIEDHAENLSKQLEDTKIHHTMLNLETTVYRFLVNNCDNTVMNY